MNIEEFTKRISYQNYAIRAGEVTSMNYINYSNHTSIQSAKSIDTYKAMINYKKQSNVFDLVNIGIGLNTFTNLFNNDAPLIYTYDNAKHKGKDTFDIEFQIKGNKFLTFTFSKDKIVRVDRRNNNCTAYIDNPKHISEEYQLTKNGFYNINYDDKYFTFFDYNDDKTIIKFSNFYTPEKLLSSKLLTFSLLPQTMEFYKNYDFKDGNRTKKIYYDEYGMIKSIPGVDMRYEKIWNDESGNIQTITNFHPLYYDLFDYNHLQGSNRYWAMDELKFIYDPIVIFTRNVYKVTNIKAMEKYSNDIKEYDKPILEVATAMI